MHLYNAEQAAKRIKLHFKRYVKFTGFPEDGVLKQNVVDQVHGEFTGSIGKYDVTSEVIEHTNATTAIHLVDSSGLQTNCLGSTACMVGDSVYLSASEIRRDNVVPHEFGHLFGMNDHYAPYGCSG